MIPEVLVGKTTATTALPSSSSSLLLHGERNNTMISSCSTTIANDHHHSSFFQPSSEIFRFPSSISTFTPTITPTTTTGGGNNITNNNQHTTSDPQQQNLKCPRCDSTNTKFCYYNNYNLTQPRHFCKTCRRYWTKGGALRNVPIGGGCRKNKLPTGNSINNTTSSTMGKHHSNSSYNKAKVSFGGLSIADINQSPASRTYGGGGGFLESELAVPYNTQVFWSPPTTHAGSHILSLLKSSSTQNPNPNMNLHHNPNSNGFTLNSDGVATRIRGGGNGSREVNGLELGRGRPSKIIVGLGLDSNRNERQSDDCSTFCQLPSSVSVSGHQPYNYFQIENRDSVTEKVHPIGGFEEMKLRRNLNCGAQPAGLVSGNNTFSSSSSFSVSKPATTTGVTSRTPINGGSEFGCFISSPLCWSDLRPTPSRNAAYP